MAKTLVAITGGIGSGKSCVLDILSALNYNTISCDKITANLYEDETISHKLMEMFPSAVSHKKLNKKIIAEIVFNDKAKHNQLTNFLAPIVLQKSLEIASAQQGVVFIEVPLLFECNAVKYFDKVLVIKRNLETRIKSVMTRSNITRQQVLDRISNQFDYDSAELSDYHVIYNDGDLEKLTNNIKNFLSTL